MYVVMSHIAVITRAIAAAFAVLSITDCVYSIPLRLQMAVAYIFHGAAEKNLAAYGFLAIWRITVAARRSRRECHGT